MTLRSLGAEIAKNLVLAGIGSLTIIDNAVVKQGDIDAQFFLSDEHINQNVGLHAPLNTLRIGNLS